MAVTLSWRVLFRLTDGLKLYVSDEHIWADYYFSSSSGTPHVSVSYPAALYSTKEHLPAKREELPIWP